LELALRLDQQELQELLQHFVQLVVSVLAPLEQPVLLVQPVLQLEPLVLLQQEQLAQEFPA
jgi:hypothetical protein